MTFKPKISLSDSDIREEKSVEFLNSLLAGYGVKTALKKRDKEANIDGYIELLDNENRINGKITAQVKTVPPSLEGNFVFDCPTSLFGYAEQTSEVVMIMAVDHKNKTILWKYISRELIEANASKAEQETIRLHFNSDERMTEGNVGKTIDKWRAIVRQQLKLYNDAPALILENEGLRKTLLNTQGIEITLQKSELENVQRFIDTYNGLMDRELIFIKKVLYPDVWKFGIAIFEYSSDKLGYYIYSIHSGENGPLIKQVPFNFSIIQQSSFDVMTNYYTENPLKKDFRKIVKKRIKDHTDSFLKYYKELPMTVPFAMETVAFYFLQDSKGWIVPLGVRDSFRHIAEWLSSNVPNLIIPHTKVVYGYMQESNLYDVYQCLVFLVSKGLEHLEMPYPSKGKYGTTGMVYDWYNAEGAYAKTKYVIETVDEVYRAFVKTNFPVIMDELDYCQQADLTIVDVAYGETHCIRTFFLKRIEKNAKPSILFSKNGDNSLIRQIEEKGFKERFEVPIHYSGQDYRLLSYSNSVSHEILFSDTPLKDTYRKILETMFEQLPDKLIDK